MCESIDSTNSLNSAEWIAPYIPYEILNGLEREHVLDYEGDSGDPDWGTPIEVDWVVVAADGGIRSIRMFNRGIMLFQSDSEDVRRLHRFFEVLKKAARNKAMTNTHQIKVTPWNLSLLRFALAIR